MSDDLLERVRERARTNLFWKYLGVEVAEYLRVNRAINRIIQPA